MAPAPDTDTRQEGQTNDVSDWLNLMKKLPFSLSLSLLIGKVELRAAKDFPFIFAAENGGGVGKTRVEGGGACSVLGDGTHGSKDGSARTGRVQRGSLHSAWRGEWDTTAVIIQF